MGSSERNNMLNKDSNFDVFSLTNQIKSLFQELKIIDSDKCIQVLGELKSFIPVNVIEAYTQTDHKNEHHHCKKIDQNNEVFPDLCSDVSIQTDGIKMDEPWDASSIVKDVTNIAQSYIDDSGFIYDESTNTYYNHTSKCHYIPESKLYYYHELKAYYYYNTETRSLCFHSNSGHVECGTSNSVEIDLQPETSSKAVDEAKSEGCKKKNLEELEEGECSELSADDSESVKSPVANSIIIEAGPKPFEADPEKHIASCIRLIVLETDLEQLETGTLFIVTCQGGSLGREGDHDVTIPDINVSKHHAKLSYEFMKDGTDSFKIIDMGSMNGTYLDGSRLSKSLEKSEPFNLCHGSTIKVGSTVLECHIHEGNETCKNCEPSCVKKSTKTKKVSQKLCAKRKTLEEQHKNEVQRLKTKFCLGSCSLNLPEGYFDRSQKRREEVGSSHCSEKTEAASVDRPLEKQNRGYLLMSKMGWKEGQPLGKGETRGLMSPIQPDIRIKNAGFGTVEEPMPSTSGESSRKTQIWEKTRLRFLELYKDSTNSEED